MGLEKIKDYKKMLYITEDQYENWDKKTTPKILRFAIEIQDMIKFIANNKITFEEIKDLRK